MNTRPRWRHLNGFGSWLIILVGVMSGCGDHSANIQRNFSRTVTVGERPLLKIDCKYVGKSPGDPKSYQSQHDYREIDTDFYRLSFTNLTDQEIEIAGISYRMADGPLRGRTQATRDSIKQTWGTTIIPPHETITHPNGFVWAKSRANRLIKTYSFRTKDADGNPVTFQEDVTLLYSR